MSKPVKKMASKRTVNELYGIYVKSARKTGREIEYATKQFLELVISNCFYCGRAPFRKFRPDRYEDFYYNGLDRKDNDKDYELGNCVPCCATCNRGKHNSTYKDWIQYLKDLVQHRRIK